MGRTQRTLSGGRIAVAFGAAFVSFHACAAGFPSPCVEISCDHPLFLFADVGEGCADTTAYAQHVVEAWRALPDDLKLFSAMVVRARGEDETSRVHWLRGVLMPLQDADVPVAVRVADSDMRTILPLDAAEELLNEFTCVRGLQAIELPFEEYYEFSFDDALGAPPVVRWLTGAVGLAARYGRFLSIELDEIRWPRVMSNAWCRSLYEKFQSCNAYIVPTAAYRGAHCIPQTAALLGLWLEGATNQWGVAPDSRWYRDAHFVEPGVFGLTESPAKMPPALYRAMILDGAMTGASVYSFPNDEDLWFGAARHHWIEAIEPTLREIVDKGVIARKEFVEKRVKVAYRLGPAHTPEEFHRNLHDIDGVLDQGLLMRAAYGMTRPGQIPELIPNSGNDYWIPLLSSHGSPNSGNAFAVVATPDTQPDTEAWRALLAQYYAPDGEGSAFIARIGRGTFIMNSSENTIETQTFRVADIPAPVRGIQADRKPEGVVVSWPFREGDLTYKVYRRIQPETRFAPLAETDENRTCLDATAPPDQTICYSVAAVTNEKETYEGVVDYGQYLVLSNVESRLAEEVTIGPLFGFAESKPIVVSSSYSAAGAPWWPTLAGLADPQLSIASAIVQRIEAWDRAFSAEDLNAVLELYSTDYEDAQRWGFPYARRAFAWFFEHYNACTMHRQIRRWEFGEYEAAGRVGVLLYCRFEGFAPSDPSGRFADIPACFPRTENGEVWIYFVQDNGVWRIVRTDPALPNFKDILSFSASPYDNLALGPDL